MGALAATAQAALAGRFLAGDFGALDLHREVASVLGGIVILSAILAGIGRIRRRGELKEVVVAVALVVGVAAQAALARANLLAVHVPTGVAVLSLSYFHVALALRPSRVPERTARLKGGIRG